MLLQEREAQSHNSDIYESVTDRSKTSDEVVPGGYSVKKKVTMCLTDEAF